jgi:creatinine amidohydrolase
VTTIALATATWVEVADFLAESPDAVALVPVGALEAHGPHLPLATDVVIAEGTARRAAAALGRPVALAPAIVYSVARYAGGFAGTVSLDEDTARAHVRAVCAGLVAAGLRRVCLVNAHLEPAHVAGLREAVAGLPVAVADPTERRFARTLTEEFKRGACHAGSYETSLVLAERPELVRGARAGLPPRPIDLAAAMRAGVATFVEAGADQAYFGDPAAATVEEGEWIYARLVEMVRVVIAETWP